MNEYYKNLLPLIHTGFKNSIVQYTKIPSFSTETAFSCQAVNNQKIIIANTLTNSFWYTDDKKNVQLISNSKIIDDELFELIKSLFNIVSSQIRPPEKQVFGTDGETFYFEIFSKDGKSNTGKIWSPDKNSAMKKLTNISDDLYLLGAGANINSYIIKNKIKTLIIELKKISRTLPQLKKMTVLTENQVTELCIFIENQIEKNGCDHSLKNTFEWAERNEINKADLIDVLECNGGFCDCEVIMNLPENCSLEIESGNNEPDYKNPFKTPLNFQQTEHKVYTKALFSSSEYNNNNSYTKNGELLIPAPFGFKPKKRVRKSVHFFNGTESELPSEIGIVKEIIPTNGKEFAKKIRDFKLESLSKFSERDAEYYLSRIEKIEIGKPMGTYFMEITGIGGTKIDLKIHKVIFR
ncbi:hypothetical protein GCM10011518_34510 [Flavobacterium limi]|uniref:DUF2695 domain-containing protein n=1 Tax=Flavobacterium limi TaxID=2045105 RepID=A0ABQ1UMK0_9FLAO|nr:hypothetical protein GCM10011518_34510 [Flavobacterium limi]